MTFRQADVSVLEQSARLVSQAAFESSARFETTVSLESRQVHVNNESTMHQPEQEILFPTW